MMRFKSIDGMGFAMVGAVVALLYIAGVRPLQETYADTVKLKAELWIASGELTDRQSSESKATSTAQQLSDRLDQLAIELSNIDQMNTRLADLTHLAEESGMSIEAVRPGDQVTEDRYRAVLITLIGRTGYEQAGTFLDAMRKQFPDTGLQSIQFSRIAGDPATGRLQIEMVWYAAPAVSNGRIGGAPR
ncbi:MAG: type 4a pilus biogenesis protein PilO [Phycisphaerales bacterium]|nr:type 4a pilus biogenesis protein PilO [Phycisphaerales bacterium]MCB9836198.1 type 4a pilus biogenesis protein PilO [Phycisphaera sp.]